jgi:DNA-directed RNA polymerase specialized sigma24 family protein
LYLYAAVLTGGTSVVMHCGLSAEDLATETLNKYLLSPNGLGWRESKGSLTAFLGTVLRNRFIDHLRRQKEVARTEDASDESPPRTENARNLDDDIAARELTDRLLDLVKGRKDEQELRDFIHAGSMISEGGKVNQQLADLLGVDEGEVVNRRKKLWRVAGVKELYEEFRHERKADQSAD